MGMVGSLRSVLLFCTRSEATSHKSTKGRSTMIRFLSALIALLLLPTVALADPPAGPPDPNAAYVKTIRAATWKYHDVEVAKKDGYVQLSGHVDNMGMHFSNLSIREFDLRRPNVLLYVKDGNRLRLVGDRKSTRP